MNARPVGLVPTLVLGASLIASAADWPQFRGPQRHGVSTETGLLQQWPAAGPTLHWQLTDIGDGYSTVAVVGDRLYTLANLGLDNEFVRAMSVQDGKTLWTTRLGNVGNPDQAPSYPKARSTPTIDGDRLYALSSDGDLACLDAVTGTVRWQKNVRKEFGGIPGTWAYAESPLVDGDLVVVTPGGTEATLLALNKVTGAVVWKAAVPGGDAAGYASALVLNHAGRKQYVQFTGKGIVGVDARTGQFLWRYDEPSKGPANIPMPVASGSYVYSAVGKVGGTLFRLAGSAEALKPEPVYLTRGLPNTNGGAVLVGDTLYGTTADGLVAADYKTGTIRWQAASIGPGSTVAADGHLYIHGENGDVVLIAAAPDAYREKGRFTPPDQPKHATAMEKAWAYPVVANGRLYIRDRGTLWSYDVTEPKVGR
jgi:outer membrane protein assembly factor BamB